MAETIWAALPTQHETGVRNKRESRAQLWRRLALGGVMLISLFMNFYQLGQNGFGNPYYAAGIRSMSNSLHNFFFVSYDPGGFVTIDKPPLGFWLQTASVKIFGFTPFSVYFPQALAGVLSVLLLYYLVRRHFGVIAGLLAALALALSPISVVTNRNNTIDSTLALVLLVGAWAVLLAAETGKLRWLLLCAAIVGIGFNIKMLEAYLVVPAFGLLYLLAAPRSAWTRVWHLAVAVVLMLVISLAWVVAVDLTPASQRPYVGSTQNNSEISLAFGYNGVQRLIGGFAPGHSSGTRTGGNAGAKASTPNQPANPVGNRGTNSGGGNSSDKGTNREMLGRMPQGGPGGGFDIGTAGPLRLFISPLNSQIAWLLPLAILGMIAVAWQSRPRLQYDEKQQSLVLWGMWLLTMGIFFSVASFFHQYYLTEMAPAICALFGIGLVMMWQDYRRAGWRGWLLPLALLLTAAEQIYILSSYPTWERWLMPIIAVLSIGGFGALILARLLPRVRFSAHSTRYLLPSLAIGVLAVLVAPAVWAAIPVLQNIESQLPQAGPAQGFGFGGGRPNGGRSGQGGAGGSNADGMQADAALVHYLEANQGNTKFLVAVTSSMSANSIILATNKPVMAIGGFSGSDPILTTDRLKSLIANGTVRFFLLNGPRSQQQLEQIPEQFRAAAEHGFGGGFSDPGGSQSQVTSWVTLHCSTVSTSLWQSSSPGITTGSSAGFGGGGGSQLYDCATTP